MRQAHVVSDDERITRACWRALALAGYQVQIASVAVGVSDDMNAGHPDVVVVDAASDTDTAHQVVTLLRALRSGSVMLAVVPDDNVQLRELLRSEGIDACIPLVDDGADLCERTTQALHQVLMRNETMVLRAAELDITVPPRLREVPLLSERPTRRDDRVLPERPGERLPEALPWVHKEPAAKPSITPPAPKEMDHLRHIATLLRVAVQMVATPPKQVDDGVANVLDEMSNRLDLQFALCFGTEDGVPGLRPWVGHLHRAAADQSTVATAARRFELSALVRQVGLRHSCFVATTDQLPMAAAATRDALAVAGIGPFALIAMHHEGKLAGFLAVGRRLGAPTWQSVDKSALEMTGDLLAGAWRRRVDAYSAEVAAERSHQSGYRDGDWQQQLEQASSLPARAAGALGRELLQALSMVETHGRALTEAVKMPDVPEVALFTRSIERASAIAEQLHTFDDQASREADDVHLNDLIVEAEPLFRALVAGRASVSIVPGASSPRVRVDANGLRRLFSEMILAGLDSKRLAGVVVRTQDGDRPSVLVLDVRLIDGTFEDGEGAGRVADGAWLEPNRLEFINDLALAAGVPVTISHDKDGTQFSAVLARQRKRRANTRTSSLTSASARSATEVMVVEDEPMLRHMVTRVLTRLGYSVHAAASAEEAMEYVETNQQRIALLVTDVCLPHRTGPALARAMQERTSDLKLLFMSGYMDATTVVADMGKDVAFLQKPFRQQQLTERVRELLQDAV